MNSPDDDYDLTTFCDSPNNKIRLHLIKKKPKINKNSSLEIHTHFNKADLIEKVSNTQCKIKLDRISEKDFPKSFLMSKSLYSKNESDLEKLDDSDDDNDNDLEFSDKDYFHKRKSLSKLSDTESDDDYDDVGDDDDTDNEDDDDDTDNEDDDDDWMLESDFEQTAGKAIQRRSTKKNRNDVIARNALRQIWDAHCWLCHAPSSTKSAVLRCQTCPRVYHSSCLDQQQTRNTEQQREAAWICEECCVITYYETENNLSASWRRVCQSVLNRLLAHLVISCINLQSAPLELIELLENDEKLFRQKSINYPISLNVLLENVKASKYQSLAAFNSDYQWLHHNCIVMYGGAHSIACKSSEMNEFYEKNYQLLHHCPDCYMLRILQEEKQLQQGRPTQKPEMTASDWMIQFCHEKKLHPIVWVQLADHPLWPAKLLFANPSDAIVLLFGGGEVMQAPIKSLEFHSNNAYKKALFSMHNKKLFSKAHQTSILHFDRHLDAIKKKCPKFESAPIRAAFTQNNLHYFYWLMKHAGGDDATGGVEFQWELNTSQSQHDWNWVGAEHLETEKETQRDLEISSSNLKLRENKVDDEKEEKEEEKQEEEETSSLKSRFNQLVQRLNSELTNFSQIIEGKKSENSGDSAGEVDAVQPIASSLKHLLTNCIKLSLKQDDDDDDDDVINHDDDDKVEDGVTQCKKVVEKEPFYSLMQYIKDSDRKISDLRRELENKTTLSELEKLEERVMSDNLIEEICFYHQKELERKQKCATNLNSKTTTKETARSSN